METAITPETKTLSKTKIRKVSAEKSKEVKVVSAYPPMFDGLQPPQSLTVSRTIGTTVIKDKWGNEKKGVMHLASYGDAPCDVLFISPCVLMEELEARYYEPGMLKGPAASLFRRNLKKVGFDPASWAYTALVRYNVPKLKPKGPDIRWSLPLFEHDIKAFKPKIIVSLGKAPLDQLISLKVKIEDIRGGFLQCDRFNCLLYAMDPIILPLLKPEYIERFLVDLKTIYWELQSLSGVERPKIVSKFHTIKTADALDQVVDDMITHGDKAPSVDSEWAGKGYLDGKLRLFQVAWKPDEAMAVQFQDENQERVLDVPNEVAGEILSRYLGRPDVKYTGHYLAADLVWMKHDLKLPIYKKAAFDTMFAQQLLDEYADLKLERLAVRYTDLGRYDLPLFLWKKANKVDENDGYGTIPDDIIIPYSQLDVITVKRVHPILFKQLVRDDLLHYYLRITLPFVSDCFVDKTMTGLPIDIKAAEEMRELFVRNQSLLMVDFKESVRKEANGILLKRLLQIDPEDGGKVFVQIQKGFSVDPAGTFDLFKRFVGKACFDEMLPVYEHWVAAREIDPKDFKAGFNHCSTDHMRRWMFGVKKLMPIKTTSKPAMAWEKVLQLPPDRQVEFKPAADKQTVQKYADHDPLIAQVQELKSVATITRSFLREPDPETGEENGLFKWIRTDSRIHANFALTETGRPRAWNPNTLNLPKSVTKPIEAGFARINLKLGEAKRRELEALGVPPPLIDEQVKAVIRAPTSIRSCIRAPAGQCLTDADLQTAEVVGLAYLSGDENLIAATSTEDRQFAITCKDPVVLAKCAKMTDRRAIWKYIDKFAKDATKVVRTGYDITISNIPESAQDLGLLIDADSEILVRDHDGVVVRPKRDVHWEMGEGFMGQPREKLNKNAHRGGGKVGMFCLKRNSLVDILRDGLVTRCFIQDVRLTDLVWDGCEWVQHEGVVNNGRRETVHYQGLWATPNHEVWTEERGKVLFETAFTDGLRLKRSAPSRCQTGASTIRDISGYSSKARQRLFRSYDQVSRVRNSSRARAQKSGERLLVEMPVSTHSKHTGIQRSESLRSHSSLPSYGATLQPRHPSRFGGLSRTRHKSYVQIMPAIRGVGITEMARYGFRRFRLRPYRQQWSLFSGQSAGGNTHRKSDESSSRKSNNKHGHIRHGQSVQACQSGDNLYGFDLRWLSACDERSGSGVTSSAQCACGIRKEVAEVYDILNAGPRHRYTCSGVLVSNSIPYGASDSLIERQIETLTGKKPEPGTGQKIIDTYEQKFSVAAAYLSDRAAAVTREGFFRSVSGRVRHFSISRLEDVEGLSEWQRNAIINPLEREARNYPLQEIVSATMARANIMILDKLISQGMQSRIMILLYDAFTCLGPIEEREEVARLLQWGMSENNTWEIDGRTLRFEIDLDFAIRWACKLSKEEKVIIENHDKPLWKPKT